MSQDPFKKEHHLRSKLDEYHVTIPDFPMKRKRWDRFIHILASPANNPLEPLISNTKGSLALKIVPIIGTIAFSVLQVLFFI